MSEQPGYTSPNAPSHPPHQGAAYPEQPGHQQPGYQQPGYPPAGQAPPPAPPQEKQKSWFARHKFLTVVGALVLVIGVSTALGGGDEEAPESAAASDGEEDPGSETDSGAEEAAEEVSAEDGAGAEEDSGAAPEAESAEEPELEGPGIGEVAADGKFEFTVMEVETGLDSIGPEVLDTKAQGQFVLVHLEVTNIGDKSETLLDSNQYLHDTEGREHSPDSAAGIYIEDNKVLLSQINPGNTLSGVLVYDIPADAVPESMTLHDSMFSGGVSVDVR